MVWGFLFVCLDWLTRERSPLLLGHHFVSCQFTCGLSLTTTTKTCGKSLHTEYSTVFVIPRFSQRTENIKISLNFLVNVCAMQVTWDFWKKKTLQPLNPSITASTAWNNSCGSKLITLRYQKDLEFTSNFRCFSCISRGGSWEWSYRKLLICHYIFTMWVLICQRNSIVNIWSVGTSRRLSIDDACYSFVLVVPVFIPCTLHLDAFRLIVGKVLSLEDIPHHCGPVAVSGVLHLLFLHRSHHK